jgi:16S rRNA C967 or C1407 C5-methylase (RsmB/RsmF family)
MNTAENEGVVAWLLATFPEMQLDPLPAPIVASYGCPGLAHDGLPETERSSCMRRFWPADQHDSIGFFFARLRKIQ